MFSMDSNYKFCDRLGWDALPLDVLVQIGSCFISMEKGNLAAMRLTCRHWRDGVDGVNVSLTPLGFPYRYAAFPRISSINCGARGHGIALTQAEIDDICLGAPAITSLDLDGAYKFSNLDSLIRCTFLTCLSLSNTTVTDDALLRTLPSLTSLETLTLRGCSFLQCDFLPSLEGCLRLKCLDLADCALALHLHPGASRTLAGLGSLEVLDLAGCGASDSTLHALATLPFLRALGLRDAHLLTEIGLATLASGPAARHLATLDLEGCSGLGEGFWSVIQRFPALKDLSLARLPQLLQPSSIAEEHAAALWRWPALSRLSLAGSAPHSTKLKLLATTCGAHLEELDISMPSADDAPSLGSLRGYLSRLPAAQIRDLHDCARNLKNVRVLRAARSGISVEISVAFLRYAPSLEEVDFSGCNLGARRELSSLRPAGSGRWWSSGVFIPGMISMHTRDAYLSIEQYRCATEDVSSKLRLSGPLEFAAALGALTALRTLGLRDCCLEPEHLLCVPYLTRLEVVNLAGNRGLGDAAVNSLAGSIRSLTSLDISGIHVSENGVKGLAQKGLPRLRTLRLARCGAGVTAKSLEAVCTACAGLSCQIVPPSTVTSSSSSLRELDVSDCAFLGDGGIGSVVRGFSCLTSLDVSGCSGLTESGIAALTGLKSLRSLNAARCAVAVTDDALGQVCRALVQLTKLSLGGAQNLSHAALPAMAAIPCLSELDLTCCSAMGSDEEVPGLLPAGMVAVVQLPQGANASTGSPLKRQKLSFRIGQQLRVH